MIFSLTSPGIYGGAELSPCGQYRYALARVWRPFTSRGLVLGINPSTADAAKDDATTRKLIGFGRRWGWGGYALVNPFAFRATDQRRLLSVADPVGPENDRHLAELLEGSDQVVCAWGPAKTAAVRRLLDARLAQLAPLLDGRELLCLGTTADGSPRHPLMLAYDTPLVPWRRAA